MFEKSNHIPTIAIPLIAILFLFPSLLYSQYEIINPFTYPHLSYAELMVSKSHLGHVNLGGFKIEGDNDPYVSYSLIILTLSRLTDLAPKEIGFFPIGGLIVPLVYFIFAKKTLKSGVVAAFLTAFLLYEPFFLSGFYSVMYYAWTFPIYISLLIIMLNNERSNLSTVISVIILFFSLQFYHPTVTFWAISLPLSIFIPIYLKKIVSGGNDAPYTHTIRIYLIFIMIYLTANNLTYILFRRISPIDLLNSFLNVIVPRSGRIYEEGFFTLNPVMRALKILYHLVLHVPLVIYVLKIPFGAKKRGFRSKFNFISKRDLVIWIALFTELLYTSTYLLFGTISTKYMLFFTPIASACALLNLKGRKKKMWLSAFLLTLLAIEIGKFSFAWSYGEVANDLTFSVTEPAATWISKYGHNVEILTDFSLGGALMLNFASREETHKIEFMDKQSYVRLINEDSLSENSSKLIVLNVADADEEVPLKGWGFLPPLSTHLTGISENAHHNLLYNNGLLWILGRFD